MGKSVKPQVLKLIYGSPLVKIVKLLRCHFVIKWMKSFLTLFYILSYIYIQYGYNTLETSNIMLVKLFWSEEIHLTIGKVKKEKKLICKFHCFICYI